MSYLGMEMRPSSIIPVSSGSNLMVIDKRVRLAELVLRSVICGAAIVSTILICTDTEVKEFLSIRKRTRFTDVKVFVFLVIANGLAAAYSLLQVLRCAVSMIRGSVLFNKPLAWAIFSGDQIMAYLTLAAVAAALQAGIFAQLGETELQWMKTCNLYKQYCNQMGQGLAGSVLVCLSMVVLSAISAFSLFRLYNDKSEKNNGGW